MYEKLDSRGQFLAWAAFMPMEDIKITSGSLADGTQALVPGYNEYGFANAQVATWISTERIASVVSGALTGYTVHQESSTRMPYDGLGVKSRTLRRTCFFNVDSGMLEGVDVEIVDDKGEIIGRLTIAPE